MLLVYGQYLIMEVPLILQQAKNSESLTDKQIIAYSGKNAQIKLTTPGLDENGVKKYNMEFWSRRAGKEGVKGILRCHFY